jgi:hypothetical protein
VPTIFDNSDRLARQQAIKQIERRRHFHIELVASAIVMIIRSFW